MSNYNQNIEILCKQKNIDLSVLAEKINVSISDVLHPKTEHLILISDFFTISIDVLIKAPLKKLYKIKSNLNKMLVIDVDGVMTKAEMIYTEKGDELKIFNARDGMGIKLLKKEKNTIIGIISNSLNIHIIEKRKKILGLDFAEVNNEPKEITLLKKCAEFGILPNEVIYIGDDVNDIEAMKLCGIVACPADAIDQVKTISHIVLNKNGGEGCIRELIDVYLR